jgi:hypothetical protein
MTLPFDKWSFKLAIIDAHAYEHGFRYLSRQAQIPLCAVLSCGKI